MALAAAAFTWQSPPARRSMRLSNGPTNLQVLFGRIATGFVRWGDVNGDGHPDAVGFGSDGVYVGLGNPASNKFDDATRWIQNYGTDQAWNTTDYTRLLADVNGDGKDDIVGYGIQGTYVSLAQSNNTFNAASLVVANFGSDQMWNNTDHLRTAADVNGDGNADLVGFGDSATYVAIQTAPTPPIHGLSQH